MPRKLIIFLCCINIVLGVGVIWYVLASADGPGRKTFPPDVSGGEAAEELASLPSETLWRQATTASSQREAYHYLRHIKDDVFLRESAEAILEGMREGVRAELRTWPFRQALIQTIGERSQHPDELLLLRDIAAQTKLSLSLRDVAFKSLIENTLRFKENAELTAAAYALIDLFFGEANSLSTLSLQAENLLIESGVNEPEGREDFVLRLKAVAEDGSERLAKRITSLSLLVERDKLEKLEIESTYLGAPEAIQDSILRALAGADSGTRGDLSWLKGVESKSPEQEQLIGSLLASANE